jgi:hypothetical protein
LIDGSAGNDAAVRISYRLGITVAAVGLLWAGLSYDLSRPVDAGGQ